MSLSELDHWSSTKEAHGETPILDPTRAILVARGQSIGDLELYREGEPVAFEAREITSDALCGWDLLALTPSVTQKAGENWSLLSPALKQQAQEEQEHYGEVIGRDGELEFSFGEGQDRLESKLEVTAFWTPRPPEDFEGGLCAANVLLPYKSLGIVNVHVLSDDEVAFAATAQVQLPGGEPYQLQSHSRWRFDYEENEAIEKSGSELFLQLPLTDEGPLPECIALQLYDQDLNVIFDEMVCPNGDIESNVSASRSVFARLAPLPEYPEEPSARASSGCSVIAPPRKSPAGIFIFGLALLGLCWRRSRALSVASAGLTLHGTCSRRLARALRRIWLS